MRTIAHITNPVIVFASTYHIEEEQPGKSPDQNAKNVTWNGYGNRIWIGDAAARISSLEAT